MALNESAELSADMKATFKGDAQKVLLPAGKMLFKFSQYAPVNPASGAVTAFWSDVASSSSGDWGLEGVQKLSAHLGVSEAEMVRVTSAVKHEWNALSTAWKIMLTDSVYAWHGPAASQSRTGDSASRFPGCNMQYYIPNMTAASFSILESSPAK